MLRGFFTGLGLSLLAVWTLVSVCVGVWALSPGIWFIAGAGVVGYLLYKAWLSVLVICVVCALFAWFGPVVALLVLILIVLLLK
jgi:hypothetical protein